jgi:Transposase DDE domain
MERELWKALYLLATILDKKWGSWRYSSADIVGAYFWAVIHDRPTCWAADPQEWPDDLRPAWLPSQSTLSRRLRQPVVVALMTDVEQRLLALVSVGLCLLYCVDGKAVAVSAVSKDPDTGYGRGAGASQKGYKLHALWGNAPMPMAWSLTTMNTSEKKVAHDLIATLPQGGGYILGDTQYDVGYLYDLAAERGYQLVAKKTSSRGRGGLGHRRQSPARLRSIELLETPFGKALYRLRIGIECHFGTLTCTSGGLAPLCAWVRRFHRVRHWVQAKIILIGLRWLRIHRPDALAFA